MFPETLGALRAALAVCADCPVRERCAAYAVESGQSFGVWGGLSEADLRAAVRAADRAPDGSLPVPAPTPIPIPRADPRRAVAATRARARTTSLALACTTLPVPARLECR